MYIEIPNDPGVLLCVIMEALEKVHLHCDLSSDTVKHVHVEDSKFAKLYILPKIHKYLENVLGRPVISNCNFYIRNKNKKIRARS